MTKAIGITICILAGLAGYFVTDHKNQNSNMTTELKQDNLQKSMLEDVEQQPFKMTKAPVNEPSLVEAEARLEEKKVIEKVKVKTKEQKSVPIDIVEQTEAHSQDFDQVKKVHSSVEKSVLRKYTPFLMGLDEDKAIQVYDILCNFHMNIFEKVAAQENIDMNAEKTARDNKIKELLNENEFKKYQLFLGLNFSQ